MAWARSTLPEVSAAWKSIATRGAGDGGVDGTDLVFTQQIEAARADRGHDRRHAHAGEKVHIARQCVVIDGAAVGAEGREDGEHGAVQLVAEVVAGKLGHG